MAEFPDTTHYKQNRPRKQIPANSTVKVYIMDIQQLTTKIEDILPKFLS